MWALFGVIDPVARNREPFGRRGEDQAADKDAIRRIAAGDPDALGELYDRHARPVYSLAIRIVDDATEAEDVVQEVFAQAWRQAGRFDAARGAVGAWLLNITRSRAIDRLRARRAKPQATPTLTEKPVDQLIDPSETQERLIVTAETAARVRAALGRLPLLQRLAIELAFYEGLTHQEIAERLEEPLGTVKTRIRLGLMKLREALAETGA
jgi:RNA polymerase sigma-70 factor (ECF subfamily)